ncbi:MAG: hypothetical protein ACREML_03280 [Vulcanimicrobiaceae bacterium]
MKIRTLQLTAALTLVTAITVACGGGSTTPATAKLSTSTTVSASGGSVALPTSGSISGATFTYPASNVGAGITAKFTATSSGPTPQSADRRNALSASSLGEWTMTFSGSTATITFTGNVTVSFASSQTGLVLEFFQGSTLNGVCPSTSSNGTLTFTCEAQGLDLTQTYTLEIVSGSSQTATPTSTPTGSASASFYTFGGSTDSLSVTQGSTPIPAVLNAYQNVTVSSIQFAVSASGSGTLAFSDAVNNGSDITPSGFLADSGSNAATPGYTPIVYISVVNSGATTINFGSALPSIQIMAALTPYTSCHFDALNSNGSGSSWLYTQASGTPSSTSVTIPAGALGGGSQVEFQANSQQILAIACH